MPSHGVIELLKCSLTLILSFYEETKKQTERLEMKKKSLRLVYISIVRSRHHVIDLYAFLSTLSSMHVGR